MNSTEKYEALLESISELGSVLIAYSGGVDSTLLAVATHAALGANCLAVLAVSDMCPPDEINSARTIACDLNLKLHEIETFELLDPQFRANTPNRCYHCKAEMFGFMRAVADSRGLTHLVDGTNFDDDSNFRPGTQAAEEFNVISPLRDVGLTKTEIRSIASMLDLPNWDKPSAGCLASRFPYGEELTETHLQRVTHAEIALRNLGLRQFRIRAHGNLARLEVAASEMQHAWELRDAATAAIKDAGFTFVAQDLEGYRSGAMDEAL